jgi:phospholipase C
MMENRSFDHLFGSLSLVEGRSDVDGLAAEMFNETNDGTRLHPAPADLMCVEDPAHGFDAAHLQWNEGACDNFVRIHEQSYGTARAHHVMGYLDRATAPASYALADHYALCQRWFCSVMGPTWPNRYYSLQSTSNGLVGNLPINEALPSLFSRLDGPSIPWAQYYGNISFSALLVGHSLEQAEYQKLDAFFDDAAAGTLPPYAHLDPIFGLNDDHPPAHPLSGQILLASIYAALAASPQWNECLLVVTYDEHGGFFDHVSPPTTADAFENFQQMGFRVPALVIGPYVKSQVSSTVFDHTSTIASVLRQHELEPINERDEVANDVWGLLDEQALLDGVPTPPITLEPIEADEDELQADACRGFGLHVPPGTTAPTGQPELDAWFDAHPSPADGRRGAADQWARIIARARALGVVS